MATMIEAQMARPEIEDSADDTPVEQETPHTASVARHVAAIDEAKLRDALIQFLASQGHEVVPASDLQAALQLLDQQPVDLLFVAERLGGLHPSDLMRIIRDTFAGAQARVVAVSSNSDPDRISLAAAGFDAVLAPNSDADEIVMQVVVADQAAARRRAATPAPAAQMPQPEQPESTWSVRAPQPPAGLKERRGLDRERLTRALAPYYAVLEALGFYLGRSGSSEREAEHVLHAIKEAFPEAKAAVWLRSENPNARFIRSIGLSDRYPFLAEPLVRHSSDEWDELSTGPRLVSEVPEASEELRTLAVTEGISSLLTIPLVTHAGVVGVLELYFPTPSPVTEDQMMLLETIAAAAAIALDDTRQPEAPTQSISEAEPTVVDTTFRTIFTHLPHAAFVISPHAAIAIANPRMAEISGRTLEDIIERPVADLLPEDDATRLQEQVTFLRQMAEGDDPQMGTLGPLPVDVAREGQQPIPADLYLSSVVLPDLGEGVYVEGVLQERAAAEAASGREAAELQAIRQIVTATAGETSIDAALRRVQGILTNDLGFWHGGIWTLGPDGRSLVRRTGQGSSLTDTLSLEDDIATRVSADREPLFLGEGAVEGMSGPELVVPIVHRDRVVGLIGAQADDRTLDAHDRDVMQTVAMQVAALIERADLYRSLERQATTDSTTGLPNRQAFQRSAEQAIARMNGADVSMLGIGIDSFKEVNDLYGMIVADDILRQMGQVLRARMQPGQILARYTSDQFAILLPGTDRETAVTIAESLRIAIATHLFNAAEQVEQLTVSIGAATCPNDAATAQGLIQAVDHALYLAKRAGRNQVFQSNAAFATLAPAHGRINDLLRQSPKETLSLLIRAMDQRLAGRAGHSERVTRYALAIARQMNVPDVEIPRLRLAAYIHDIGMVSLPDALLRKPGALSDEEKYLLRGVPVAAHGLLAQLDLPESVSLAVLHQRENVDGSGYPTGLTGEDIPLGARIIAVADAIDAMTSARAHRETMTIEEALAEVRKLAGTQFDPAVVEAADCLTDVIRTPTSEA
jgi:diguanylate cyclase (GGDEF)-like protein